MGITTAQPAPPAETILEAVVMMPTVPVVPCVKAKPLVEQEPEELTAKIYPIPLAPELQQYLFEECGKDQGLYILALALMGVESEYQPHLISKTGDYGLMQVNKGNHQWLAEELAISDFFDPKQNIRAGIYVLELAMEQAQQDKVKALMVYKLGPAGAKKKWTAGITTNAHASKVLARMEELEAAAE